MIQNNHASPSTNTPGKIGIGLDFGTSNSTVAFFDGENLKCLEIPDGDTGPTTIPTALYISKELLPLVGNTAVEKYITDNRSRQIRLTKENVGRFDLTVTGGDGNEDGMTMNIKAHALTDQDLPGRLFRGIKSWLGNPDIDRVNVFGKSFTMTALLTPILDVLLQSYQSIKRDNCNIHVGRPVNFVGDSEASNNKAITALSDACSFAQIRNPTFFYEPVAAATSFLFKNPVKEGTKYLLFDFGGGTLDLSVLETTEGGFNVLGTGGLGLGGNLIDISIYQEKIFPQIGRGTRTYRNESSRDETVDFRFHEYEELLIDWQNAYQLNTPHLRNQIAMGIELGGDNAVRLKRLRSIIVNNLSYEILRIIERAKIELSEKESTTLSIPDIDLDIPFSRDDFRKILEKPLNAISDLVTRTLAQAGISKEALAGIICTGGSSEIPMVRDHLEKLLNAPIIQHDSFTGIAAGLAIANYFDYSSDSSSLTRAQEAASIVSKLGITLPG